MTSRDDIPDENDPKNFWIWQSKIYTSTSKSAEQLKEELLKEMLAANNVEKFVTANTIHIHYDELMKSLDLSLATISGEVLDGTSKATKSLEKPPGHRLILVLLTFMSRARFERLFGQVVADSRELFYEALSNQEYDEAKKIKRELTFDIIKTVAQFVIGLPAHWLVAPFKAFTKGE